MYYLLKNGKLRIPAQDIAEVCGLELQEVNRTTVLGRLHLEVQAPDRLVVLIDGEPRSGVGTCRLSAMRTRKHIDGPTCSSPMTDLIIKVN